MKDGRDNLVRKELSRIRFDGHPVNIPYILNSERESWHVLEQLSHTYHDPNFNIATSNDFEIGYFYD
jgi:hypothetical protein